MLTKLAVKNAKNAFKDSIIYFITLVLGVSIFYIFNSIYAQEKIMSSVEYAQESLKAIGEAMSYVSVAVAVILAFLVVYANNFFIKRRKKEFGIYLQAAWQQNKYQRHIDNRSLHCIVAGDGNILYRIYDTGKRIGIG